MWICFNDAFVSAVQDRNDADRLCVRARNRDHLKRLFPNAEIIETPDADYACRVFISKNTFAEVLAKRVGEIRYDNFKNSVREASLHELYEEFWHLHRAYQQRAPAFETMTEKEEEEGAAVAEDDGPVLRLMRQSGIPLTRRNYIDLSCGVDGSVEWGPEHEAELPSCLKNDP